MNSAIAPGCVASASSMAAPMAVWPGRAINRSVPAVRCVRRTRGSRRGKRASGDPRANRARPGREEKRPYRAGCGFPVHRVLMHAGRSVGEHDDPARLAVGLARVWNGSSRRTAIAASASPRSRTRDAPSRRWTRARSRHAIQPSAAHARAASVQRTVAPSAGCRMKVEGECAHDRELRFFGEAAEIAFHFLAVLLRGRGGAPVEADPPAERDFAADELREHGLGLTQERGGLFEIG